MSLQTFPYVEPADAPAVGSSRGPTFATEITVSRNGREQRRPLSSVGRERLDVQFPPREGIRAVAQAIEAFFRARKGSAEAFVLFDFDPTYVHAGIYVGDGNGTTTQFDLPCRVGATSVSIYLDGVLQSSGFTLSDAGANGRRRVTFTVAPTAGKLISCDFTGQRAFVVRFESDRLTLKTEQAGAYSLAFSVVEVPGES